MTARVCPPQSACSERTTNWSSPPAYFLGLSEAETAIALGLRRGTVKSRLSRALGRLHAQLEESTS